MLWRRKIQPVGIAQTARSALRRMPSRLRGASLRSKSPGTNSPPGAADPFDEVTNRSSVTHAQSARMEVF